jgi:hypothetical protein
MGILRHLKETWGQFDELQKLHGFCLDRDLVGPDCELLTRNAKLALRIDSGENEAMGPGIQEVNLPLTNA